MQECMSTYKHSEASILDTIIIMILIDDRSVRKILLVVAALVPAGSWRRASCSFEISEIILPCAFI